MMNTATARISPGVWPGCLSSGSSAIWNPLCRWPGGRFPRESYLELFQSRFVPGGLYLLDEPEAGLSPLRQLGFLALLKEMVIKDAQFIISTHSPILMAFPQAQILKLRPVSHPGGWLGRTGTCNPHPGFLECAG